MSAIRVVDVDLRTYAISDDLTTLYQALITGAVAGETGNPGPASRLLTVTADRTDVQARAVEGGLFVVAGFPDRLLLPLAVTLTFSAPGFYPASQVVTIPASADLPIDAGTVPLRRTPIRLQGRVVENTTARSPISGALVAITTPKAVVLRTPVHFDHPAGIVVRQRALNATGTVRQLIAPAASGGADILLNDSSGLAPGGALRLGSDIDAEYAAIAAVGPAPGRVALTAPLKRTFAAGIPAQPIAPGVVGAVQTLARPVKSGNSLLLLNAPLTADTVEISDGSATEYGVTGALTNAQGFYRLDGVGGLAAVDLKISAAGYSDASAAYAIDYAQPVNVVSFRLSP